ncbi:MAG: outer membrane beta-barrel protein [Calditrichia bacterium]|nr:outer membrane beta-barrel protein [Calditrichia bacterium]
MFKCKTFVFIIIFLCISGISLGQEATKTGIGIAIIDLEKLFEMNTSVGVGATITVPIITSPGFRIEPEVGYFSASEKATISGTTYEESVSSWRIGVGIFPQKMYEDFTLYYGGRVGYISQKQTSEGGGSIDEETTTGFFIAPAIGGEHNFSDHFSIGAEAQIVYATLTNEEDDRDYDVDLSLFDTRGLIFFRFYF